MNNSIHKVLYIDIETVSAVSTYSELDPGTQELWAKKCKVLYRLEDPAEDDLSGYYSERAAIYAEFGKIVCISMAYILPLELEDKGYEIKYKSWSDRNEFDLLQAFSDHFMNRCFPSDGYYLAGHNIAEFDVPYLCRRLLINGLTIPPLFQVQGKKPWETNFILDSLKLWKFGDYKNYTSLALLCNCLNIPSPKENLDGSQVSHEFWQNDNLEDIKKYCEKDVEAVIRVFARLAPDFTPHIKFQNSAQ